MIFFKKKKIKPSELERAIYCYECHRKSQLIECGCIFCPKHGQLYRFCKWDGI